MKYRLSAPKDKQLNELVEIRLSAMKPSLVAINRFDPIRARKRFTETYDPANTTCILMTEKLVGFYVLIDNGDHLLLDHFYIKPEAQGKGLGSLIVAEIKNRADSQSQRIKLGALRGSKSNDFYKRHGFVETHESEFDIHYQYTPSAYSL